MACSDRPNNYWAVNNQEEVLLLISACLGENARRKKRLTGWADIDVNITDDVFDGFYNFLEDVSFDKLGFKHCY